MRKMIFSMGMLVFVAATSCKSGSERIVGLTAPSGATNYAITEDANTEYISFDLPHGARGSVSAYIDEFAKAGFSPCNSKIESQWQDFEATGQSRQVSGERRIDFMFHESDNVILTIEAIENIDKIAIVVVARKLPSSAMLSQERHLLCAGQSA